METVLEHFSWEKLELLYSNSIIKDNGKGKAVKELTTELKEYLNKYFFITNCGIQCHYNIQDKQLDKKHYEADEIQFYNDGEYRTLWVNRMPTECAEYIKKEDRRQFKIVCNTESSLIDYEKKTKNKFRGFRFKNVKHYDEFSDETKNKLKLYLELVKEIVCGNKEEVYDYIIKWIANMFNGKKNESVLYLKTTQEGIGKSTFIEFLYYCLGFNICSKDAGNMDALVTQFNSMLCGQLLVVFEEMPVSDDKQWALVSGKLKDLVTGDIATYNEKNMKHFKCENINNYIINTNVEAIKDSQGRRIFILPIDTKRAGQPEYFLNIKNKCYNDEVAKCFIAMLKTIDLTNFNSGVYPMTDTKLDAIANRMDEVYKYLKNEYILNNKGIDKILLSEFYLDYVNYYDSSSGRNEDRNYKKTRYTKIEFNKKLSEIGIKPYLCQGVNKFNISKGELLDIFKLKNFIHTTDVFLKEEKKNTKEDEIDYKKENEELKYKLKQQDKIQQQLQDEIKRLTELLKQPKQNEIIKQDDNIIIEEEDDDDLIIDLSDDIKPKKVVKVEPIKLVEPIKKVEPVKTITRGRPKKENTEKTQTKKQNIVKGGFTEEQFDNLF